VKAMKTLDYFYENYLVPMFETFSETFYPFIEFLLNIFLAGVLFITVPVWLIPYLIVKHRKGRKP
jgi:hypothetical protein